MFDKDTMIIAYDEKRGEPRGPRKKNSDYKNQGLGDCNNCTLCVQVCPAGIDIRNGLQYQCISCSACIDACNEIMDKMGYPKGLIRYTTENALQGKPAHILRLRVFIYASILLLILGGLFYAIINRSLVQVDVISDRNSLYRETDDGFIENVYKLRIMNKDKTPHIYEATASGIIELLVSTDQDLQVDAESVMTFPIRLKTKPENLFKRSTPIVFRLIARDNSNLTITEEARFLGPLTYH
jgi:cytochrome c oxidase accessory protein FixG